MTRRRRKPKTVTDYVLTGVFLTIFLCWLLFDKLIFSQYPSLERTCLIISIVGFIFVIVLSSVLSYIFTEQRRQKFANIRDIYGLGYADFERYVGLLYERMGYQVRHVGGAYDSGVDLRIVSPEGTRGIIQCKCYTPDNPIGPSIVREMLGVMTQEHVAFGLLVTTTTFTDAAKREVKAAYNRGINLQLIDGHKLLSMAKKVGLPAECIRQQTS